VTRHVLVAALFIVAAGFLRFYRLEDQGLWNDEMFSFDVAASPFASIQSTLIEHYHHPPLYFYLAHCSIAMFGKTAWALRAVSALFGALTVGLVYFVSAKMFGKWSGLPAGLLCLVAPFHLAYSQEGRPYALAAFLCLLSTYMLYEFFQERSFPKAVGYLLSMVALLYTHHWGLFVFGAHVVAAVLFLRPGRPVVQVLLTLWLSIIVLYLPEAAALRVQATSHDAGAWFWAQRPTLNSIIDLTQAFGGTFFKMASSTFDSAPTIKMLSLVCCWIMMAAGVLGAFMFRKNGMQFLMACVFLILATPFLIAFFRPEAFLWYRYPVIAFPLFCICLGGTIELVRSRWHNAWFTTGASLVGVLVLLGIVETARYYGWEKSNTKAVAAYVQEVSQDSVHMIIRPRTFAPLLNYYYHGKAIQYDEAYLDRPLGEIVDTARSFVYISLDLPNPIKEYMESHFDKTGERRFPGEAHMGIIVSVYAQKPDM